RKQTLKNVPSDKVLRVNINDAKEKYTWDQPAFVSPPLFREITKAAGINYNHVDFDFIDFNIQTTLPHKLSEYCPALAAADIDGNGFDDLVIGGNFNNPGVIFFQQKNGKFLKKNLQTGKDSVNTLFKDEGMLLFDANGDGYMDLYVASGGFKSEANSADYQDRLYINNGKGAFVLDKEALPENHTSKLCVRSMDYNRDGKPDLFVSGRVDPWHYPKPVSSFIFRNDSKGGKIKFTDVTNDVAPDLKNSGMVCDALFTDFDNDGQIDLILTGEWMPVTLLKNVAGKFKNVTPASGLGGQSGWWNSIVAGDFRHTGRMDYIVGNLGLNSLYKASEEHPVYITAGDFEHNGGYEAIPSLFLPAEDGTVKEYPSHGRDDILDKLPGLKKRFNDYRSFATATMSTILPDEQRKNAQRLKAVNLQSSYLRNDGNGKFTVLPLPDMAQVSALNGMVADDFDGDGNLDVLINGNDYATEVSIGRYDALNGLLLKGNGKGGFTPLSILQSGIFIPGDGKALVKLRSASGNYLVAASQYKDALKLFQLRDSVTNVSLRQGDLYALIKFRDGRMEKKEFYCGSSFLSQSSGFFSVNKNAESAIIYDNNGYSRKIQF
nr:VCBS repeat-containing protein [Chitinophagaceae bacterium]